MSIIFCIISRLKRDEQTDTYVHFEQTATLREIVTTIDSPYVFFYTKYPTPRLGEHAQKRFLQVAQATGAVMLYSDYYTEQDDSQTAHPTIDYQLGSVRDDFDFGSILLFRTDVLKKVISEMDTEYNFAALYDLRLRLSREGLIFRIPEFLYSEKEHDSRRSGEKQFDYVNPRNREVQIEMEQAFTAHLKAIGAYLPPAFKTVPFQDEHFETEVSVIIPVRNRERPSQKRYDPSFHNRPISSIIFSLSTIIPPTTRPLLLKKWPKSTRK